MPSHYSWEQHDEKGTRRGRLDTRREGGPRHVHDFAVRIASCKFRLRLVERDRRHNSMSLRRLAFGECVTTLDRYLLRYRIAFCNFAHIQLIYPG